ncbi:hypothetical protein [Myroides phaeus]|uniref:YARHG domain-containing protein n=1 Tax=Myroides phaeus TaxID=702745 RepID=A0A1G8DW39_9FLAO|nr:hypothetical protein [Myroides phaeus]SDH61825.1 hypothetical protein SAMN05421818_10897 [Myroides phaeus]
MKRKLFKKVLLTLTVLFGLSGVANAQVDPKVEAQVKEQSAKELKLIKDYLKLEDTGLEKLEEILVYKNFYLLENDLKEGRTIWTLRYDYLNKVGDYFFRKGRKDLYEKFLLNELLLEQLNLNVLNKVENDK